jgi:hypothetical protein
MDGIYLLVVLEKLEIFQHIKSQYSFLFLLLENWRRMMGVRAEVTSQSHKSITLSLVFSPAAHSICIDLSRRINEFVFASSRSQICTFHVFPEKRERLGLIRNRR